MIEKAPSDPAVAVPREVSPLNSSTVLPASAVPCIKGVLSLVNSVSVVITGVLGVTDGGTGLNTIAKGSVLVANSLDTLTALDGGGGAGLTKILLYDGDNDTLSFGSAIDGGTFT